jgi:alpha-N-arabinofuranosidase
MNRLVINADLGQQKINRHIYGHFAEHLGGCIYDGLWVGEESSIPNTRGIRSDVVEALRAVNIPNLRWPGGCFADAYHWKDGIGPQAQRPRRVNFHWGDVIEDNHFGTHEFLDLCEQLGCEPYICGNVGSGSPQEMSEWIEYLTFAGESTLADQRRANGREEPWKIKFWGIGNENWGCGGFMKPEHYVDLYRQFQVYTRSYSGNELHKIASGMGGPIIEGTELLMRDVFKVGGPRAIDALCLHYYVYMRESTYSDTEFGEAEWFGVLKKAAEMEDTIQQHAAIMDYYDPGQHVGLIVDEWGTWYPPQPGRNPAFLYQQNTLRDALVAGLTLHIFHDHADRVRMANLAQTVNVLQAMIFTEGEKMVLTPTYHVFEMYKGHQDATRLPLNVDCGEYRVGDAALPAVSASASRADSGEILLTLCNLDPSAARTITCELRGGAASAVSGRILTADAMTAHNTFERPNAVHPVAFSGAQLVDGGLSIQLPAKSVVALTIT